MSQPFQVGKTYITKNHRLVKIIEENNEYLTHATVKGYDGIWRYNRPQDRGRCTGTNFDMSDPRNLIPEE